MFKRIMSTIMAVVIATMTLPLVSINASAAVSSTEIIEANQKWLCNLFNSYIGSSKGFEDNSNYQIKSLLDSGISYTIVPTSFDSNGKATSFLQVDTPKLYGIVSGGRAVVYAGAEITDNSEFKQTAAIVKNAKANSEYIGIYTDDGKNAKVYDSTNSNPKSEEGSDHDLTFGTLGVYCADNAINHTAGQHLFPIYAVADAKNPDTESAWNDQSGIAGMSFVNTGDKSILNSTQTDPLAVLTLMAQIHVLYHTPETWKFDGGENYYAKIKEYYKDRITVDMPVASYFEKAVPKSNCNDARCPCWQIMSIKADKGTKGCTDGCDDCVYTAVEFGINVGTATLSHDFASCNETMMSYLYLSLGRLLTDVGVCKDEFGAGPQYFNNSQKYLHGAVANSDTKAGETQAAITGILSDDSKYSKYLTLAVEGIKDKDSAKTKDKMSLLLLNFMGNMGVWSDIGYKNTASGGVETCNLSSLKSCLSKPWVWLGEAGTLIGALSSYNEVTVAKSKVGTNIETLNSMEDLAKLAADIPNALIQGQQDIYNSAVKEIELASTTITDDSFDDLNSTLGNYYGIFYDIDLVVLPFLLTEKYSNTLFSKEKTSTNSELLKSYANCYNNIVNQLGSKPFNSGTLSNRFASFINTTGKPSNRDSILFENLCIAMSRSPGGKLFSDEGWASAKAALTKELTNKGCKINMDDFNKAIWYSMYTYASGNDEKLTKLYRAIYTSEHNFGEPVSILQKTEAYPDEKLNLKTDTTLIIQKEIDSLVSEFNILNSTSSIGEVQGALTIKVRSQIVDLLAKYSLSPSVLGDTDMQNTILGYSTAAVEAFAKEMGKDTKSVLPTLTTSVNTDDANYKYGQYYNYYQCVMTNECRWYLDTYAPALVRYYLSDGAQTLEGYSNSLMALQNVYYIVTHYNCKEMSNLWYGNDMTDEDDKAVAVSLADIYDYLVKCGQLSSDDYYAEIYTENNPITTFWSITNGNITMSKDLMTGRAMSATYVPMQTNLYDPYNLFDYVDMEWIEGFHSKYGFHRKALYIDTNVDAAVDSYVSGNVGKTRVATLEDLLQPDKDIVLYLDDNYYNITGIAEKLGKATDRVSSEELERNWFQSFQDMMGWADETEPERMLKSAEYKTYSYKIAENTSGMDYTPTILSEDGESVENTSKKAYDDYLLTADDIGTYLVDATSYSDMMAYALVSNIYRDKETYNVIARTISDNRPVFVSSPTLATLSGVQPRQFDTIYNYALLKNIQGNMMVGYDTSIDVTSPIYMDVYGNIVTESGICVIPAACNATLHESSIGFTPIAVGFLSTYGSSWKIPTSYNLDEAKMNAFFVKNEEEGVWDIRAKTILGVNMNFAALSYSDPNVKTALKEWYEYDLNAGILDKEIMVSIVHEVIRGAPIEYIDMDYEGLNLARKVDKTGILAASKLDGIIKSLDWDDDGSIMSVPTMSFIDNYQYIIVFVFKILLVIIVTALMITVYIDAVRQRISGRTVLKCISTLIVGVGSVLLLPTAFDLSYYQSNKLLLQDEAEYIMLLNTEKNMSGQEVGVYEVTEPEQHTQVLLRLENYSFDWMSHLNEVVFGNSVQVLDEAYDEFLKESFISDAENVQIMNDGVYMDIQDIFNTSVLNFSTSTKHLYQKVSVDPVTSFYLPYYYFLDAILTNMNDYNSSNNIYAYSTKIMRGGNVKTVNLCDAYFNSEDFMDGSTDVLGLYQLYSVETSLWYEPIYSTESISQAQQSQWYVMDDDAFTTQELVDRVNLVVEHARKYVNDNRDMIGRITDETFIKCMAMSCAVYYNNLFGIPSANSYEIYKLSNADLMRLTVCDKATTLEDSPMSFARFVYNEAGTPGVYASVFLVIITMFTAIAKTVITLAVFILLLVSLYVFKILLQKGGDSVAGYLLTLLVICATNVLYAVILKISLAIPQTGLAPTICILLQILVQLAYLFILTLVLIFAIRDWRNIGATFYREAGSKLSYKFRKLAGKVTNRRFTTPAEDADAQVMGTTDTDKLEKLRRRQARRQRKVGES